MPDFVERCTVDTLNGLFRGGFEWTIGLIECVRGVIRTVKEIGLISPMRDASIICTPLKLRDSIRGRSVEVSGFRSNAGCALEHEVGITGTSLETVIDALKCEYGELCVRIVCVI